jgi:hypothetical protein
MLPGPYMWKILASCSSLVNICKNANAAFRLC